MLNSIGGVLKYYETVIDDEFDWRGIQTWIELSDRVMSSSNWYGYGINFDTYSEYQDYMIMASTQMFANWSTMSWNEELS